MTFQHINALEVHLNDTRIGALAIPPNSKYVSFQYDPKWVANGYSISPILLPLDNEVRSFPNLSTDTWNFLPPPIADCLPDKFGNALIESELSKEGVFLDSITPIDRLAYVASHSIGALEFWPEKRLALNKLSTISISELVSVARSITFGEINSESSSKKALVSLLSVGTSAGGARPKAVININPETGEITSGQEAEKGLEPWLLKFDGVGEDKQLGDSQNYGKIEYAYSLMAKAAGIMMPETRLLEENGRSHFMVRRFDRQFDYQGNPYKIHTETLCGMSAVDFNLTHTNDYAQLFTTLRRLNCPEEDITEAFRRMVFNYAFQNCDDHSKNFSFIMDNNQNWRLSPAYDITFAYNPNNMWLKEHLMGVMGKYSEVTKKDFMVLAKKFEVQYATKSINEINHLLDNWSEFGKQAKLSKTDINNIAKWHEKIS
jgi:serine/threonine-protein kinase HipA